MPLHVEFSLKYSVRRDKEAKVFVAYVPLLRLFAQSKTKNRLADAVKDLVRNFVKLCHERGMLEEAMRSRGLVRAEAPTKDAKKSPDFEYITIMGNEEREVYEVPITLLAGKQEKVECHQ